eukprot:TRINITY_DN4344_c0_g1_i1.p1 TRINITY_DN4344_c0_g1~~TRINITY_DN4344_c0_g1_i1.p1  ORF type:complete len:343 (-),score=48.62 TRINITY_DN4344_c0_g1_i1:44-1072(-)
MSDMFWNTRVVGHPNYVAAAPCHQDGENKVRMLVVSSNYYGTTNPLNCSEDARNIEDLARQCEVPRLSVVSGDQCTRDHVLQAVQQISARCRPDDYFILYIAGFGASVKELGGQGADAQDDAFVCVDHNGECSLATLIGDSELSEVILSHCNFETRVLIITDCCYPRTIVDLSKKQWNGRQALCISGCRARQTASEPGLCGVFSHSLLLAVAKLSRVGYEDYSVGALYNATLHELHEAFDSVNQDLAIQAAPGFAPAMMAWPLIPNLGYESPIAACIAGDEAEYRGVRPEMLHRVNQAAVTAPVSIEAYISHVLAADVVDKGLRTCTVGASRVCYAPSCVVH